MAQGVKFGTNSKDKFVRMFRVKSDHSGILQKKADGDAAYTDIDDAEFTSKIIGNIQVTPQDDGSNQIQFTCAAYGEDILDFINSYKSVTTSTDITAFEAFHGEEFGSAGSSSSEDQLLLSILGPDDEDTSKILALSFLSYLEVANTGGFTIQPKNVIEVQLTFSQVKPKQDLDIHLGDGSKSIFDDTIVDHTAESSDISLLTDSFKYHHAVTAV